MTHPCCSKMHPIKTDYLVLSITKLNIKTVVNKQKVSKWKITKTEVVNEIEIFIILTKYNTRKRREEGTHCSWWQLS